MRLARIFAASLTSVALAVPAVSVASASAESAAKETRTINAKVINLNPHKLQMRARVVDYTGMTFLQKKNCKDCKWAKVSHKPTTKFGRVFYPVDAPRTGRWYYRVGTPARAHFRQSYSRTYYTYTR